MTIEPTNPLMTQIDVNCRICEIQAVFVNGIKTNYDVDSSFTEILDTINSAADAIHSHPSHFCQSFESEYSKSLSKFEVHVQLPENSVCPVTIATELEDEISSSPAKYKPITLEIQFVLHDFEQVLPILSAKVHDKIFTQIIASTGKARNWFPCIDDLSMRCPWELTFMIPFSFNSEELFLISTGKLIYKTQKENKKVLIYKQEVPLSASNIVFVLGNFERTKLTNNRIAYYPPGFGSKISASLEVLGRIFDYFNWYLNSSYPFACFYLVFGFEVLKPIQSGNYVLVDQRYLFDSSLIDQALETRELLCHVVAAQYFSVFVSAESLADYWVSSGIGYYLGRECHRILHGNNEYKFKLKKDIEKICFMDVNRPPLYNEEASYLNDAESSFVSTKASLVFFLLEQHLSKAFVQKIIICLFEDCKMGAFPTGLSTNYFMKTVKKTTGKDLKAFADKWIFSSGIPSVNCSFALNRKNGVIEFCLRQTNPSNHPQALTKFTGPITVRVFEADGTYDHVIQFEDYVVKCELPFHTKFRKPRKKIKKGTDENPDDEEEEAMPEDDKEEDKELDDDDLVSINSPISWMQIDPDIEWLLSLTLEQPDFMWIEQLENDKNVISQYEAVVALERYPSEASCFALERIVGDWKCFYKVRQEAAYSLASCGISQLNFLGTHKLIQIFAKKYCITGSKVPNIVKANNFEQIANYFIQKSLVSALSLVREEHVIVFLLNLLKYNDNSKNQFSDCLYVACVIDSLSFALAGEIKKESQLSESLIKACLDEIERYRQLDLLFPSFRNVITVSCIQALVRCCIFSLCDVKKELLILYARYGNFVDVRLSALQGILLLWMSNAEVVKYLLELIQFDPSSAVKEFLLKSIIALLKDKIFNHNFGEILTKTLFWELVKNNFYNPKIISLLTRIGHYMFRSMDYPSDECTLNPILILPTISYSKITSLLKEDKHDLGSSDDETNYPSKATSTEKDWLSEMTGEAPKTLLVKTSVVDKPRVSIATTPNKKSDLKLKLAIPITPSAPKPQSTASLFSTPSIKPLKLHISTPNSAVPLKLPKPPSSEPSVKLKLPAASPLKISVPLKLKTTVDLEETKPENGLVEKPHLPLIKLKPMVKPESEMAFCLRILKKLQENKLGGYFNFPVDPIRLNIPIYFDIVKHPMDFGTIEKNLEENKYQSSVEFESDVLLVFRNCFTFNSIDSDVYKSGRKLQQYFLKEMQAKPIKTLEIKKIDEEARVVCNMILEELMQDPLASPFIGPVDHVALNLPKYPDIVLHPIDLCTISSRLEKKGYMSMLDIEKDILQVFQNCMDFNMEGSTIYQYAVDLQAKFKSIWSERAAPLLESQPTLSQWDVFSELLETLKTHEFAAPFLYPVDYVSLNLPTYPKLIKHPMDFSKIQQNIAECKYPSPTNFMDDVTLVFRNCYTFNGFNSPISICARAMETIFVEKYNAFFPAMAISLMEMKKKKEYMADTELFPPENFAIVSKGVYRSSFPKKKNFGFLKKLKLKTVLTLILEDYPEQNMKFLEENDIKLLQFGVPGNKEPFVDIPEDVISSALSVLLDSRNHPVLIHCNKGKHRTGCLVGCIRRFQHWTFTSIFEEYRKFAHPKARSMDEQFIELFHTKKVVVDKANLPKWPELT